MADEGGANSTGPDLPQELYVSQLDTMSIHLNEIYESLKRSGFRADEAIQMVAFLLSNMMVFGQLQGEFDNDDDPQDEEQDYDENDDYDDGFEDDF